MEIRHRGAAPRSAHPLAPEHQRPARRPQKRGEKTAQGGLRGSRCRKTRRALDSRRFGSLHTGRRRTAPGRGGYFGENHIRSLGGTVPRPGYGVCPRDTDAGSTALRSHLGALRKPAYLWATTVHTRLNHFGYSAPYKVLDEKFGYNGPSVAVEVKEFLKSLQ